MRTLVIVPAWNEEVCIGETIAEIRAASPVSDILVVDDGSSDKTGDKARAAGAFVLRLPYNLGVGGAMRLGYRYALANDYDVAVQVDADGQHDPKFLSALTSELQSSDLVIGARFAGVGDYPVKGPRRWAMVVLSKVLSRITRADLSDTTSGFRACGRKAIALFAVEYPMDYLGDTIDTLIAAARHGLVIRQIPVAMRPRRDGKPSQSPVRASLYLVRAGLALLLSVLRR